jgi:hypothetical protein
VIAGRLCVQLVDGGVERVYVCGQCVRVCVDLCAQGAHFGLCVCRHVCLQRRKSVCEFGLYRRVECVCEGVQFVCVHSHRVVQGVIECAHTVGECVVPLCVCTRHVCAQLRECLCVCLLVIGDCLLQLVVFVGQLCVCLCECVVDTHECVIQLCVCRHTCVGLIVQRLCECVEGRLCVCVCSWRSCVCAEAFVCVSAWVSVRLRSVSVCVSCVCAAVCVASHCVSAWFM